MKVKTIETYGEGEITSIEEFVGKALEGDLYASFSTERMTHKCAEALARLCDVLADKGILSLREVVYIAKGYKNYAMLEEIE